ncbi:MAG: chemotaxis response regulator protein-glutamate methylesterase [bacterium]|nr:chemotaxis response regulator protein-glutamate methylesterase [bacterium]
MKKQIKVLIVDDSLTFRSLVRQALKGEQDITVIGSVRDGCKAMDYINSIKPEANQQLPDVVTLDVEMPCKDGLQTLKEIMEFNKKNPQLPEIGVIMVSSFTPKGADITIKALENGAFDFIAKPQFTNPTDSITRLRNQLLVKLRHYSIITSKRKTIKVSHPPGKQPDTRTKKTLTRRIQAVLIGVSTGGPQALVNILPRISDHIRQPVLIVQHMPATFTTSFAKNLDKRCKHKVQEPVDGDAIEKGKIYVAPGGKHMLTKKRSDGYSIVINETPPENGFRPSVDVLFRSAADTFEGEVIALILTGMGTDGTKGLAALKRSGAYVIAQDEDSSIVWGMPGSAVQSGNVDEVLPLNTIPDALKRLLDEK